MNTHKSSFIAQETRFQGRYKKDVLSTLIEAYRPWAIRLGLLLFAGLLGRIALLGNANLIGLWADSLVHHQNQSEFYLKQLIAATSIGLTLNIVFRIGLSRLSAEAISSIYDETTWRTSRLPLSFFDSTPTGRIITRFASDYNNIFRVFGGPLAEFVGLIFDLVAMTLLIGLADVRFLPFWFFMGLLNFAAYRSHLKKIREARRESALARSPSIAHFAEVIQTRDLIHAYGKEKNFSGHFEQLNIHYLKKRLKATDIFARFSFSMSAATATSLLLVAIYGSYSGLSLGALGVAFTYFSLCSSILQSFFEWLGQFEDAMTGLERMNEYLRLPLGEGEALPPMAKFQTHHPQREKVFIRSHEHQKGAHLKVSELSLRYRPEFPLVLCDISFELRPSERLGIIGKTGSGKSSLAQALLRLYPLEKGNISINGDSHLHLDRENYRSYISYITQTPALFIGTIRDNLTNNIHNKPSTSSMISALSKVQFLGTSAGQEEYTRCLDFLIEENGRNLSSGERQLLSLARCLLMNSPIVVLDEATSSIDPQTEKILTKAMEEFFKDKTQIIIAHRLSTIQNCHRILWLDQGKIRALGTPEIVLRAFRENEKINQPTQAVLTEF